MDESSEQSPLENLPLGMNSPGRGHVVAWRRPVPAGHLPCWGRGAEDHRQAKGRKDRCPEWGICVKEKYREVQAMNNVTAECQPFLIHP